MQHAFSLFPRSVVHTHYILPHSQEDELKDAILLVFANKQDQPGSLTATEVNGNLPPPDRVWVVDSLKSTGVFYILFISDFSFQIS